MDSVLSDTMPVTCQIIEEWTNKKVGKIHVKDWNFVELFGIEKQTNFTKLFAETWNRWYDIHPCEEYIGGKVGELMLLGQVDIVTAAYANSEETKGKKHWLERYHVPYSNFITTPPDQSKINLNYDVWIDDSPRNAEAAIRANKSLLLYTQPWNMNIMEEGKVKRIFSLSDARRLLTENNK